MDSRVAANGPRRVGRICANTRPHMNAESPQLKGWRRAVEQLESAAMDVWARPLVVMVVGFALAAAALLAGRMLPQPMRVPAETATLAALLLPGYVRLVTLTAAERLEERAVLVERLVEIATRD